MNTVVNPQPTSFYGNDEKIFRQLGRSVPTDFFIRECIVNAIEAGARVVKIGPSTLYPNKISVIDDGVGFTDFNEAMKAGAQTKSSITNKGWGAKLSILKRSPYGAQFFSVYDGVSKGWFIAFDPAANRPIAVPEDWLLDQGTEVILMGASATDETIRMPEMQGQEEWDREWIGKVINRRFWKFRDGVTIKYADQNESAYKRNAPYRHAFGLKYYLETASALRGTVTIATTVGHCRIHWFILPEKDSANETGKKQSRSRIKNVAGLANGVSAVLYNNELYEIHMGLNSKLPSFGIRLAKDRVFLILEPLPDMQITDNATRTVLEMGNDAAPVPYQEIADSFRKRMPAPLVELQETAQRASNRNREQYHDKKLYDLFAPDWYAASMKKQPGKKVQASEGVVIGVGGPHGGKEKDEVGGGPRRGIGPQPGFVPDKNSRQKKLVRSGRGIPNIRVAYEEGTPEWAMSFSCNETESFSDALIVLNTNWFRWPEYAALAVRDGRIKPTNEDLYNRAVRQATAAILSAMMDCTKSVAGAREKLASFSQSTDKLTSIADSIRYQIVDGVRRESE